MLAGQRSDAVLADSGAAARADAQRQLPRLSKALSDVDRKLSVSIHHGATRSSDLGTIESDIAMVLHPGTEKHYFAARLDEIASSCAPLIVLRKAQTAAGIESIYAPAGPCRVERARGEARDTVPAMSELVASEGASTALHTANSTANPTPHASFATGRASSEVGSIGSWTIAGAQLRTSLNWSPARAAGDGWYARSNRQLPILIPTALASRELTAAGATCPVPEPGPLEHIDQTRDVGVPTDEKSRT